MNFWRKHGCRRKSFPSSLRWAGLGIGLVLLAAIVVAAPEPGRKLRVTDPSLAHQIEQTGGELVADYGSFRVLRAPPATVAALVGSSRMEIRADYDRIELHSGVIDTAAAEVKAARQLVGQFTGRRLHLIQFAGPVQASWYADLKQHGVDVVTYIPNNAYLVYGDARSLMRLQSWASASKIVQWDGEYRDTYKIHPKARPVPKPAGTPPSEPELYAIQLVADAVANRGTLQLIDALKAKPIRQQYDILNYVNVIVPLSSEAIAQIAGQPDVVSIQPYHVPILGCFAGPLVVWLVKRHDFPFVEEQGKEAVNFQLTMFLAFLVSAMLAIIVIGFILGGAFSERWGRASSITSSPIRSRCR